MMTRSVATRAHELPSTRTLSTWQTALPSHPGCAVVASGARGLLVVEPALANATKVFPVGAHVPKSRDPPSTE
jgi:hypothetical protein